MCSSYTPGMGSTRIDGTAPVGADLAGVTNDGVLAEYPVFVAFNAGFLALGPRSFGKLMLV